MNSFFDSKLLWVFIAVAAIVSMLFFGRCYSEHRDLGFTRMSSIMSCSG